MINISSISHPPDTVLTFDALYSDWLGQLNDVEAVNFYSDLTRLINAHIMTPPMHKQLLECFHIVFETDPSIHLICAEAFKPTPGGNKQILLVLHQDRPRNAQRTTTHQLYVPIAKIVTTKR